MASKNYYYLKLKEDWFDSDELKILESRENGYLYSNILLKMYLKALKNNGKLTFNEYIPYDIKMLSTITGHNVDIVEKAIKIFNAMHLIEILDNGVIYMLDMQKMIGSISSEGIRKAEYRERIKKEKEEGTLLGQSPDIISISDSESSSKSISEDKDDKKDYGAIWKEFVNSKGEDFKVAWQSFMDFRKGKKGKDTDYALYLLTRDLQKFTLIEEEQIEIINNSLKGKWTGIYALKNKQAPSKKTETYGGER